MHKEVLNNLQLELLPTIASFKNRYGLVGGTAIALHLGHRKSIDFDLFTNISFKNEDIVKELTKDIKIESTLVDKLDELSVIINQVKLTFFKYPFPLTFSYDFENVISMPDILTLAAMKAYALGRRSRWKDYVDLYYITNKFSVKEICLQARNIFKEAFNEKLFREQLCFVGDIDFTEKVELFSDKNLSNIEIIETLNKRALG